MRHIRTHEPHDAWTSPPCTAWTAVQNINMSRYGIRPKGEAEAFDLLDFLKRLHKVQRRLGGHSHHEQSNRSRGPFDSGHWPSVINDVKSVAVSGCAVGLKNKQGQLLAKAWRIESTSNRVLRILEPFKCSRGHTHGLLMGNGKELAKTASYFAIVN